MGGENLPNASFLTNQVFLSLLYLFELFIIKKNVKYDGEAKSAIYKYLTQTHKSQIF